MTKPDPIQLIKTKPNLTLKPNGVLVDPSIPFVYQRRASLIMISRMKMILGDDVGLGKTLETLVMFSYVKAADARTKLLVFTEKNAFRQWKKHVEWLLPDLTVKIINAETHTDPVARARAFRQHGVDVLITGYGSIYDYSHHIATGMGERWVGVADEPNYFKNTDTILHKNTYGLFVGDLEGKPFRVQSERDAEGKRKLVQIPIEDAVCPVRTYGLTATVIENRLDEAFGIFRICAPGTFASRDQFERSYCVMKKVPGKKVKVISGYKNLDQFRKQIEPTYYGRLQDDPEVKQDLPEVITKDLEIEMSPEQSKKVMEATDRLFELPDGSVKDIDVLPSLILSQQLVNDPSLVGFNIPSPKTEALIEMAQNSLAGERIVIFSKFRSQIDKLEEALNGANMATVRITGKETQKERERSQDRFMSDAKDRVNIMLITKAGMKAVDLQKGGHLFFFDLPWSYGHYRQIIGRLKRTGSTYRSIGVYRMLGVLHPSLAALAGGDSTIDHYTLEIIAKKFKLWQAITGDEKEIESSSSDAMDIWEHIRNSRKTT